MAHRQDLFLYFCFLLVARDVSALSLRPDHAPGLEGIYPGDDCLDCCRGRDVMDADRAMGMNNDGNSLKGLQ